MSTVSVVRPSAPAVLDRARALVTPIMRDAVASLGPSIRLAASYHLGWCHADGRPASAEGGKCVRPALALLSAEAVGADAMTSLPGGAAVQLVHEFSLVHDDLMDGDRQRRHRPTVWAEFGMAQAILVGEALHCLAHQLLLDVTWPHGLAASRCLAEATARMIAGQAQDLANETAAKVSFQGCLDMGAAKTGAILSAASAMGAILAGAADPAVEALAAFGLHLGLAFQAVDDLLGIWGDPARTGKPVAGDLRQHKQTLPVVAALDGVGGPAATATGPAATATGPAATATAADRRELHRLLGIVELSEEQLARAAGLLEACGARAVVAAEAQRHLEIALEHLAGVELAPGPAAELVELANFVTKREL